MSPILRTLIRKEISELRRDRRVLLLGIIIPIFLYPVIMWGTSYMESKSEAETAARTLDIVLTGDTPELLEAFREAADLALIDGIDPDDI